MLCLKKEFAICLLITTSLFFSTALVFAETSTVSWDANTESDLSGYKIYYGTSSGSYDDVLDVGNTTSFPINNLVVGTTHFFVVTAFDLNNFSEPSDEAFIENVNNYSISPDIQVVGAALDQSLTRVHLVTSDHRDGD